MKKVDSDLNLPKIKREDSFDPYHNVVDQKQRIYNQSAHLRKKSVPMKLISPDQISSLENSRYLPKR